MNDVLKWFFAPSTFKGWIDMEHKVVWVTRCANNDGFYAFAETGIDFNPNDPVALSKIITDLSKRYAVTFSEERPYGFYCPRT